MELKKNPDKDLDNLRGLFISAGAVLTLLITIGLFQYSFSGDRVGDIQNIAVDDDDMEEVIVTEIKPPPPPKIQVPQIEIVEDEEEIEEEDEPLFEEAEEEMVVEEIEEVPVEEEIDEIFMIVETPAEPPGGMGAFRGHLGKYLSKNYPERAKKAGIQGTVFINFYIDKDGTPKGFNVLKGIGGGCDEAAIQAIKAYGKWSPPKQRGKPVKQQFNIPVKFKIG